MSTLLTFIAFFDKPNPQNETSKSNSAIWIRLAFQNFETKLASSLSKQSFVVFTTLTVEKNWYFLCHDLFLEVYNDSAPLLLR